MVCHRTFSNILVTEGITTQKKSNIAEGQENGPPDYCNEVEAKARKRFKNIRTLLVKNSRVQKDCKKGGSSKSSLECLSNPTSSF